MDAETSSKKDTLLYLFFISLGTVLVFLSFIIKQGSRWPDLLLNIGATLISTSLLAFLYQRFSSQSLIHEMAEMRRSLVVTERSLELGITNMWRERRHIENSFWNEFTRPAQNEVWLFGVAELGYAADQTFHGIVSDGTARGCNYKFLLLDPNSTAAKNLDRKEGGGQEVQGRIQRALKLFEDIQKHNAGKPGSVEIRVFGDLPHVNLVRSDSELLVTLYMPPLFGYELFSFRVQNVAGGIFEQQEKYFKAIWSGAKIWESEARKRPNSRKD